MNKSIIVLVGPSASGKNYFGELLNKEGVLNFVSDTTRPMRAGEVDGNDYNFISEQKFAGNLADGKYIQHNPVGVFNYGVNKCEVLSKLDQSDSCLIVVAPQGVGQIKAFCEKNNIELISFFFDVDFSLLHNRHFNRIKDDILKYFNIDKELANSLGGFFSQINSSATSSSLTLSEYSVARNELNQEDLDLLKEKSDVIYNKYFTLLLDALGKFDETYSDNCVKILNTHKNRGYYFLTKEIHDWILPARDHVFINSYDKLLKVDLNRGSESVMSEIREICDKKMNKNRIVLKM